MTRYRDRSAVPDWALLALMATAVACGRERTRIGPDERAVPITTTTQNETPASNAATILRGAPEEETPS